ncbi:MAG TPA: sigma-54 dependent transcriptional regulator [Thermoanaerobaculia bacterium]
MDRTVTPEQKRSASAALDAVSAVVASLGRVLVCIDRSFMILYASEYLDEVLGAGTSRAVAGMRAEELFGIELMGPGGSIRTALAAGERREGWRAALQASDGTARLVALTAAPFRPTQAFADSRIAYVVVMRPAEESPLTSTAPTVLGGLVARSAAMLQIFDLIRNLRTSDTTVLLTGERGTGKELVARAIHENSPRRKGEFVAVSCGGLTLDLLEAELFGQARGTTRERIGAVERANHGTLFLDEVGDLPPSLQLKVLRLLQEQTYETPGEVRARISDARIIAAATVDLRRAASEGKFREDLYYRLRIIPIDLPPLRARREDIEPMAMHVLARVNARHGRALRFSPEATRTLLGYSWPGNVRELENALEYAVAVCRGQTILPEDLPPEVTAARPASAADAASPKDSPELARLRAALEAHRWRREEAAAALGISRTTLWRKMREHGLL